MKGGLSGARDHPDKRESDSPLEHPEEKRGELVEGRML